MNAFDTFMGQDAADAFCTALLKAAEKLGVKLAAKTAPFKNPVTDAPTDWVEVFVSGGAKGLAFTKTFAAGWTAGIDRANEARS